jgi:hypothetical protein
VDRTYPVILPDISGWTFLAATFDDCFGHILLTEYPIDPTLFCYVRNFEGLIFTLLVGVFITFLKGFGFEI